MSTITVAGKKIKDLAETTALNDTDDIIVENATPKTQRVKWSTIYNAIKTKLASWAFEMDTTAKTLPGAVNELNTDLTTLTGKLAGSVRCTAITLKWESNTTLRGYALFPGTVLNAVGCIDNISGTPVDAVSNIYIRPQYGGTGSRVEVWARGTFVSGHVLQVQVLAIVKE